MDDYNIQSLTDSRNAYTQIFVDKLSPVIQQGFNSIYNDSFKICSENDEDEKYLMTFQNFLARIPKWNENIISSEVGRIKENTNCNYLEDLLTCVHVTQLKILTNIRVGSKQKKISLSIPELSVFIHKVYIECARKIYKNVYLYETDVLPIIKQKHRRELELLIKDSILITIRENMPIESILKAYLDESSETDVYDKVEEEEVEEIQPESKHKEINKETDQNQTESEQNILSNVTFNKPDENIVLDSETKNDKSLYNVENINENDKSLFETDENYTEYSNLNTPSPLAKIDTEKSKVNNINDSIDNNGNSIIKDNLETNMKFIGDNLENGVVNDIVDNFDNDSDTDYFDDNDNDFNNIKIHDTTKPLEDITNLDIRSNNDISNLLEIEEL